ncbi:putative delta-60 repeat protein [Pseudomonas sp. S30_BP2TU TE3576]
MWERACSRSRRLDLQVMHQPPTTNSIQSLLWRLLLYATPPQDNSNNPKHSSNKPFSSNSNQPYNLPANPSFNGLQLTIPKTKLDEGNNMDVITHNSFNFPITNGRDPDFGDEGAITLFKLEHELDLDRHVKGIKVLEDDRILVGAWLARNLKGLYGLARFNPDGSVDTSFADNGLALGNFANGYDSAGGSLAMQADGRILMLGWSRKVDTYSPKRLVIARFDHDGAVDQSFGQQGCVMLENSSLGELVSDSSTLQIMEDGRILISATYLDEDIYTAVAMRINTRGDLDKTFNKTGRIEIKHPAFIDTSANALLVKDNTILIAGSAKTPTSETQGYIARYSINGELDNSFGDQATPGFSTLKIPDGTVIFHDLIDTAEGQVVGIGQASTAYRNWGLLVGLDASGNPHSAFNGGRPVLTLFDPEHGNEWVCGEKQADGKILTAGGSQRLYTARYQANGLIDRSFGQHGSIKEDTPLVTTPAQLQLQANGRVLLAGNTIGIGGALGHIYAYLG